MSNNQILTGTVKYYADTAKAKDFGHGPRFNALLVTPSGEQRVYAGVGTEQGNLMAKVLGKGSKGKRVSIVVDDNFNFQGLANGQPPPAANGGQAPQAQGKRQSIRDLPGKERVEAYCKILKACYDQVKKQFDGEFPLDVEDDLKARYTHTLFIAIERTL